jgi:hypothetical protein
MAAKSKAGANTKKAPSKSEIYAQIAEDTGLTKKDVAAVFESLACQIRPVHYSRPAQDAGCEKAGQEGQNGC